MSSLASVFNSCSTIFTIDIYKKLRPLTDEKKLLRIGKIATTIVVVLGIIWIPIMNKIGGGVLYQYLQSVQSYIAPPITAVFLLGILWKRVNSQAAIVTLFSGLVVAALRICAEIYQADLSGVQYSAIKGLSLGTLTEEQRKISKENISVIDVVLSVMLIVVVVAVLFYFTG